jgi:hypothetical protein
MILILKTQVVSIILKVKIFLEFLEFFENIFLCEVSISSRGCDGEKTEFHHDFVKSICSQTLI